MVLLIRKIEAAYGREGNAKSNSNGPGKRDNWMKWMVKLTTVQA